MMINMDVRNKKNMADLLQILLLSIPRYINPHDFITSNTVGE